jgi:PST family polysaccharide transporter
LNRGREVGPVLRAIIDNAGWLLSDKLLRLGIGVLVGAWMARYLGPERFGLFNYALAIVALFGIIANLGIDRLVVRDIVKNPEARDAILGGAFLLKLAGGFVALAGSLALALLLDTDDPQLPLLVGLTAFTLLVQAFDTMDLWFQSQLQSRYAVIGRNLAYVAFAAIKVALIVCQAPLVAFAAAVLGEAILAAVGLATAYRLNHQRVSAWRAEPARMRELMRHSWPLLLSGLMVTIYMRIDQVMLGRLMGVEAVGIYSAGTFVAECLFAVPLAIVASAAPVLAKTRESDAALYRHQFKMLFRWLAIFSCALALPISLLAEPLTALMFGDSYRISASVLAIHIWTILFVALGTASGQYLLLENQNRIAFQRTLLGAALNIMLNFAWIPGHGPVGSAWAALVSFAAASLFLFQNACTRACLRIMLASVWPMSDRRV